MDAKKKSVMAAAAAAALSACLDSSSRIRDELQEVIEEEEQWLRDARAWRSQVSDFLKKNPKDKNSDRLKDLLEKSEKQIPEHEDLLGKLKQLKLLRNMR